MKIIKFLTFVILHIFNLSDLEAQEVHVEGFGGHSYFLKKNAGGYDLGIGANYSLTKVSNIGISLSHSFNDITPLPSNLTDAKIILKEESNRLPLGAGFGDWENESAWPKIRLEEQPNRYFRFNIGLHYTFLKSVYKKNYLGITMGALLSWRDESELIKLIETSKLRGLFFRPTDDHSIPVFSYNTYLDIGTKCEFSYVIKSFERVSIAYRSGIVYYPKSSDIMINNGLVLSLKP